MVIVATFGEVYSVQYGRLTGLVSLLQDGKFENSHLIKKDLHELKCFYEGTLRFMEMDRMVRYFALIQIADQLIAVLDERGE